MRRCDFDQTSELQSHSKKTVSIVNQVKKSQVGLGLVQKQVELIRDQFIFSLLQWVSFSADSNLP